MSRFRNLEFDETAGREEDRQSVPKDEAYYLAEGQAAFEGGRFEQGLRAYAKALEFNPNSPSAWTGQVRMLIELGEFREAKLWADKALETFPHEPDLLAAKAVALARGGDVTAALAFSDASIEERGNTPYVWLARGDVMLARKEKRAEFCFDKALALASFDWLYLWLASRVHAFYRQFAKALKLAQRALETAPSRAVVWLQLGQCQWALGLTGVARDAFEQARELDPDCKDQAAEHAERATLALGTRLAGLWRRLTGR